jgi:hypothetical protein
VNELMQKVSKLNRVKSTPEKNCHNLNTGSLGASDFAGYGVGVGLIDYYGNPGREPGTQRQTTVM